MTKSIRFATALLVLALPGGLAAAEDSTDATSALVQPVVVERGWVARDSILAVPNAVAAPPGDCTGFTYGQPVLDDLLIFATPSEIESSVEYWSAESTLNDSDVIAPLGAGAVDALRWWGISEKWDSATGLFQGTYCSSDDAANRPFEYIFYTNDGGLPGRPVARRRNTPSDRLTDLCWDCAEDDHFVAEYNTTFANPIDGTQVAWISIRRVGGAKIDGTDECAFLWVSEVSLAHDEKWVQNGAVGTPPGDLTYCVDKSAAAPSYLDIFYGDFERGDLRYWTVGAED